MNREQPYIALYNEAEATLTRHSPAAVNARRRAAFDDFQRLGFPTLKEEKYRYTDMGKLFEPEYGLNLNRLEVPVNQLELLRCDVPHINTSLHFVVNDMLRPSPHSKSALPEGVVLCSLQEAERRCPGLLEQYYGRLADTSGDGLTAFNTAFCEDGVLLYVPKGTVVEKPVQLVNVLKSRVDLLVNRRLLVIVEEGAEVRLLACDHALDDARFLATQVVELYVGAGATVDFYELEETHERTARVSNLYLKQERGSNVLLNNMTLLNGVTRNTTEARFAGEGATLNLCGMAVEDKHQHVDNHTFIDHAVPGCTSNELYKYVLGDSSVGAFSGKVLVRPHAQKTVSRQTNRNLCATREARMYTRPQLEIYADDVKCGHGATVGQLDDNALFYMRQRGIPLKEARLLLMFAFVGEVIDTIRLEALKERLHLLLDKRFRGELHRCRGCSICK
ncbi:MAG: Fe-S cluster assembly protein SufD [Prevotellaceae bacterium]|nr:Fe-S cluster assembly protein SufD [Prevotellaceae bacterium]